jgi:hypothetical protein
MRFVPLILTAMFLGVTCPASAADHLIAGGTTETAPITLSGDGDTLTIEESGELSVTSGDAAVQVQADDFLIYNAGTISYLDYNSAIYLDSALNGQIINATGGRIESAVAGVAVLSSTLDLLNAGSIEALDSAIVTMFGELTLLNTGEITGFNGIEATGGTLDIVNSGKISGTNYGIRLNGTTASTLDNEGTVEGDEGVHQHASELTAVNSGTIYGSSIGFSVHDSSTLDLLNAGTIEGGDYGLFVYDDLDTETSRASVLNAGAIVGSEAGVRVADAELSLVNTGSITGSIGLLQSGTGHVDLVNAGQISGYLSLSLEGSGNTVTLLPGSSLEGAIYLTDTDNDFIIAKGLNALLAFESSGEMPANIDTSGMPFLVDPAGHRIAVLDTTAFAMADEMLNDLALSILGAVSDHRMEDDFGGLSAVLGPSETVTAAGERVTKPGGLWVRAFGGRREEDEGRASWSSDHRLAGLVTGIGGSFSARLQGDVFLGGAKGRLEVDDNAQDVETGSVYGGVHLSGHSRQNFAEAVLLAGWQENDSSRDIADNSAAGGLSTAEASYGGFFIVPEITFGRDLGPLMASLSVRYAGLFLEAYEETGSSADLAVESRSVHGLASRLELSIPRIVPLQEVSLLLEPRFGLDVRTALGDEEVAVELLGADLQFDAGAEEPILTMVSGATATFRTAEGAVSLRLSGDAAVGGDGSTVISAALGGEVAF